MSHYRLKGTSGAVINQAWSLEDRAVIGSAEGCAVRVESDTVAPRHAEVRASNGRLVLSRLGDDAELYVNGEAVTEAELASGDEIRIGNCRWLLQAPGLKPEKVLTEAAVRRRVRLLPWVIAGGLSALALLAWRLGWLPF
jgi:hypothetical protein